ncbi:MAG: tRNA (adenosine(37)-N6)-dimethylallyltransferase MiaA [Candidatus Edwardsbacteria bacterium]
MNRNQISNLSANGGSLPAGWQAGASGGKSQIPKIPVLVGPTGVGKTEIGIVLGEKLKNVEIISCDSRQIYRYLDIGTAKPTKEEQKRVVHHLIDIVDPDEDFTAADYGRIVQKTIREIRERNKVPIIIGGCGLYLKTLSRGIFDAPKTNPLLRKKLQKEKKEILYQKLKKIDAEAAKKIHPNDLRRIVRALEVYELTGTPISLLQKETTKPFEISLDIIGLCRKRKELYQRIEKRIERMLSQGLVEETEKILQKGYSPELKSLQTFGYREIIKNLRGELSLSEAIDLIKRESRNYAKRQMTWFRGEKEIEWIEISEEQNIDAIVRNIAEKGKGKEIWY